jgi:hypothetical protein
MLAGTAFFLLIFPIYFAVMPTLIGDDLVSGGSNGISADWEVSFIETPISLTESINLGDGDTHDTFFDLMTEMNIGYVELDIDCNDNDDPGPGFTDSVDGSSDVSQVEGEFADQDDNGVCGNGENGFTMRWDVTDNYTGANFTAIDMSESELREMWTDGELGRGTWGATITAHISSPPSPLGSIVDNDEDYEIIWTAITYELVLTPVVEVEA